MELSVIMVKLGLALISPSLIFIFGDSNSEMEKKSTLKLPYNMKTSIEPKHSQSSCEKWFRQGCVENLVRTFSIVNPFAVQYSTVFKDGSIEFVGKIKLVRVQSLRFVKVLVVDIHLNFRKKLNAKCCIHEYPEEPERLPLLPPPFPQLLQPFLILRCALL